MLPERARWPTLNCFLDFYISASNFRRFCVFGRAFSVSPIALSRFAAQILDYSVFLIILGLGNAA